LIGLLTRGSLHKLGSLVTQGVVCVLVRGLQWPWIACVGVPCVGWVMLSACVHVHTGLLALQTTSLKKIVRKKNAKSGSRTLALLREQQLELWSQDLPH
jgi:uncharacterized membrane protein